MEQYLVYGLVILGYLLGSIPFGLVLCHLGGYGDIRKIGSGNIGATNVLRTGNKLLAFITLIGDIGKGAAAVFLTQFIIKTYLADFLPAVQMHATEIAPIVLMSGLAAILGHMFPVWLSFKGGKGVATTLGTVLAVSPILGVTMCGIWLFVAFTMRISSLSALTAFALAPVLSYVWLGQENLAFFSGVVAILVFYRHKENIKRLLKGEEPKIGKKKKA